MCSPWFLHHGRHGLVTIVCKMFDPPCGGRFLTCGRRHPRTCIKTQWKAFSRRPKAKGEGYRPQRPNNKWAKQWGPEPLLSSWGGRAPNPNQKMRPYSFYWGRGRLGAPQPTVHVPVRSLGLNKSFTETVWDGRGLKKTTTCTSKCPK